MKRNANCRAFRASMVHFQADELGPSERRALQDHVDACPSCARRLEFEDGFLRALNRRLGRRPAPPGLETRIRESLRQVAPAAGIVAWFRSPGFAAAAAALLLLALILPGLGGRDVDPPEGPGSITIAAREVLVVDRPCDGGGRNVAQQRNCRQRNHTNALKVGDGTYWSFTLEREIHRQLLIDPEMRGHRLVVTGEFYPEIRTLDIAQFKDLGREPL